MAVTPSSARTCMIIRAPDRVWPASGCPKGRGWMTVSLMGRTHIQAVTGGGTRLAALPRRVFAPLIFGGRVRAIPLEPRALAREQYPLFWLAIHCSIQ